MGRLFKRCSVTMLIKRFMLSFIPGIIIYELINEYKGLLLHEDSPTELAAPILKNGSLATLEPPLDTPRPPHMDIVEVKPRQKTHIQDHVIFGADDIHDIKHGGIDSEDPKLLGYIRRHIHGPSQRELNITDQYRNDFSQIEQSVFVDFALGYRKGGFFVDCGAGDGELFSNTLFFERDREWSGLLIEPNADDFSTLLHKRRKAFSLNACVSPSKHSSVEVFRKASGFISGLRGYVDELHSGIDFAGNWWYQGETTVQCYPLYSILLALDRDHIDYLSLDVEGPEVEILDTIPFDKLRIDVITVEYRAKGQQSDLLSRSLEKLGRIREVIGKTGLYDEIGILPPLKVFNRNQAMQSQGALEKTGLDVVFRRSDLRETDA
ncbi:hypothetical protein CAPTEDRAFT_205199 [Capitella teleta]|uniref:Methyltransferase FkbM domain-containing protein n=1 Tax=Capitella teleta TaxID=283909 RepID=R7TCL6_CAPTE|nr:hypothetical protein CAPTEDRAFT_205199 [Capitella teleta]|eukprot:ELT88811.1 hypothetical protein CAPTEDRAFT_205199 [Capitella teleta]